MSQKQCGWSCSWSDGCPSQRSGPGASRCHSAIPRRRPLRSSVLLDSLPRCRGECRPCRPSVETSSRRPRSSCGIRSILRRSRRTGCLSIEVSGASKGSSRKTSLIPRTPSPPKRESSRNDPVVANRIYVSVDGRVREWLNLLLAIHTPYNPRVPTQQSFSSFERLGAGGDPTVRRSKKDQSFLVVTHRDTLNALLRLLTSEESPVQVDIADGVSAGSACGNAGVCRVRLGWDWNPERGLNSRRCVGVIESWGEDAQMS